MSTGSTTPAPGQLPLDLHDPAAMRAWLARVETGIDDAIGAAEDQLRPLGERDLGRAQARRIVGEAKGSLDRLLATLRGALSKGA